MGTISRLPLSRPPLQIGFQRAELTRILDLYGRMVAAGEWRDYAIDFGHETAMFSAFRRTAERPDIRIIKNPSLHMRQGMWSIMSEGGVTLRRGHELASVLAPIERRLVKIVS